MSRRVGKIVCGVRRLARESLIGSVWIGCASKTDSGVGADASGRRRPESGSECLNVTPLKMSTLTPVSRWINRGFECFSLSCSVIFLVPEQQLSLQVLVQPVLSCRHYHRFLYLLPCIAQFQTLAPERRVCVSL